MKAGIVALGLALALLGGCATRVAPPLAAGAPAPAVSAAQAESAWARVLERFVDDAGDVDFERLAADRADLDLFVGHVAESAPQAHAEPRARLAYMINAYNALSMYNVIASGIPLTHAGFNKLGFFVLRQLRIGGQWMSLLRFENDVIRPEARRLGEPRVHFALNCSARSCPQLPRRPFTAAGLEAELTRETTAFFAREEVFRIEPATRTLWLSEILKFYTEDFVPDHAPDLIAYANRHSPQPAPTDYRVRFTPYDWTVSNARRPR